MEELKGTVTHYNYKKGFGFIALDGHETDLFFHIQEVQDDEQKLQHIQEGDKVVFSIGMQKGREVAGRIRHLK